METPDGLAWVCHSEGRNGGWYSYDDGTGIGEVTPTPTQTSMRVSDIDVPRGDSQYAMHVYGGGYVESDVAFGGALGASMHDDAHGFDASAYSGIRFWARGMGVLHVHVPIPAIHAANDPVPGECEPVLGLRCYDHYLSEPITLSNTWQLYEVPFASLHQRGYGLPVEFEPLIRAVEFRFPVGTPEGPRVDFDFWIDDLAFLPRTCEPDGPVSCALEATSCDFGAMVETTCSESCTEQGFESGTCADLECACDAPADPVCWDGALALCDCMGQAQHPCNSEIRRRVYSACYIREGLFPPVNCYADFYNAGDTDCEGAQAACTP